MRNVTLIAGLPGSGKSYLARSMSALVPGSVCCDDPVSPAVLLEEAGDFTDLFACHPDFCLPAARTRVEDTLKAEFYDVAIRWIFFANEPDACSLNAAMRDEKPVSGYIRMMTKRYVIPENADVREVYKPARTPGYG